jgi:hypothetical protein
VGPQRVAVITECVADLRCDIVEIADGAKDLGPVTLAPGYITKPARGAAIVNFVFGVKSPRNWAYMTNPIGPMITILTRPTTLYGGPGRGCMMMRP